MTKEEMLELIYGYLDRYGQIHQAEWEYNGKEFDKMAERDALDLYEKIEGSIEAIGYERSAERMRLLKDIDPDGNISIDQAIEYLKDAAEQARSR